MTLLEDVPNQLSDLLVRGELDLAIMARPDGFQTLCGRGTLFGEVRHRLRGPSVCYQARGSDGRTRRGVLFFRINCEFYDVLDQLCTKQGVNLIKSYNSEREDWILTMIAAGLGVCFLPEYTATFPGVIGCPVVLPSVKRSVCLVTVTGRRPSSPVKAFMNAVRRYPWPSAAAA